MLYGLPIQQRREPVRIPERQAVDQFDPYGEWRVMHEQENGGRAALPKLMGEPSQAIFA